MLISGKLSDSKKYIAAVQLLLKVPFRKALQLETANTETFQILSSRKKSLNKMQKARPPTGETLPDIPRTKLRELGKGFRLQHLL